MKKILLLVITTFWLVFAIAQTKYNWQTASSGGYSYKTVANDPTKTRFYKLKNGLSLILTVNKKEPRIAVQIAVRAGSNTDPATHTGLAHYLEHMLFKGTDKFGTLNWAEEKKRLDSIDALYERYNTTIDAAMRKEIYKEIDRVSGAAAKFSIANEYDKMMAAIGSQGTNAHTYVEETVYEEDIPANALEKFMDVQAERFRNPILRIFHTELEAVYEEKNRSLDNDGWKVQEAAMAAIFPTHNYGQQTTIGTIEHLKNPSLVAIRNYYNKYYVPNNIAIVMSGDFDFDKVVKLIETKFAYMKPKPVQEYAGPKESPISGPVVKEVFGPSAELLRMGWRIPANHSREAMLALLASKILYNGKAGLLDLNLNKQQKLQAAVAFVNQFKDYGMFVMNATPKQGQTLDDAKQLLLEQIALLKEGKFDDGLIAAIAANEKLAEQQGLENNYNRVAALVDGFIKHKGEKWNLDVAQTDMLASVTKQELIAFAKAFFTDNNYVIVYKRKGEDKNIVKVEKPAITPVETNAGKQSPFVQAFMAKPQGKIAPVWLDFSKDMQQSKLGNQELLYTPNSTNSIFRLYFRFPMGSWNNKLLPIALQYLQFIGTDKMSAEQISQQFYQLACSFSAQAGGDETTVSLTGLQQNFGAALGLLENLIRNGQADEQALAAFKNRLARQRSNNKLNRQVITSALRSYAQYGAKNPFNYTLSDAELAALKASDLVQVLHDLFNYTHSIMYYGPETLDQCKASLAKLHDVSAVNKSIPAAQQFARTKQDKNEVYFAQYDMVQAELYWLRNLDTYDPNNEAVMNAFNTYFGTGMGAIVFQTIRESKALAYSTYASVQAPQKKDDQFMAIAYVGTQADKMKESLTSMNELLNVLPMNQQNFNNTMSSLMKDMETERIDKDNILFSFWAARKKGWQEDPRKAFYARYQQLQPQDLVQYHGTNLSNKPWSYYVLASDKKIDMNELAKFGEVKRVSLEELFGY
ncbi:MAG: insulinase family protein [Chitinophagales bacterium]|nr:insulinase family protein [Chitinophagales bacterium]